MRLGNTSWIGSVQSSAGALRSSLCSLLSILPLAFLLALVPLQEGAFAQAPEQRLQQGKEGKNKYRGGVDDPKKEMQELFKAILISGNGDSKADKWYSPHLRDIGIEMASRIKEAVLVRGQTVPFDWPGGMLAYCTNRFNFPVFAACPETVPSIWFGIPVCLWHGSEADRHRPMDSCFARNTLIYKTLTTDSNFKACCVKAAEDNMTSEEIASRHTTGDGWAGMLEYYWPTSALGWENDRTTTRLVEKSKVTQCVEAADKVMSKSQNWVSGAIERNAKAANGGTVPGDIGNLQKEVQEIFKDIEKIRPSGENKDLRFSDSLQSEGLTLRVNLAALDPAYRKIVARRFCMRPEQFDKLMSAEDPLQKDGGMPLEEIPVWASYCKEGAELMTNPEASNLLNIDGTNTNFQQGMGVWRRDPMYCQRMNLENANMWTTGIGDVINQSTKGPPLSEGMTGYTCLQGGSLNGGMVPVTLNRHAAVERRTAIADHAVGFLIAGGLFPTFVSGQQSYYKRFEPQSYSQTFNVFSAPRFKGTGTNELGDTCESLQGEMLQGAPKSDRLYISNVTHEPFTQAIIDDQNNINKYVQEWAEESQQDKIANRGLDEKSSNYASAFRIFATCPAGMLRWRPPPDEHDVELRQNLDVHCKEEHFGGSLTK